MAAKTAVTPKNTSASRGLQLTTAQQAAYNKAYAATATAKRTQLALASSAQGLRKYRLQAAHAIVAKARAARASAQTAAIAAAATRRTYVQSRFAHQNAALQARIEANMLHHATLAGQAQYVAAGEKAYAHSAVMATLTTAQATSIEARVFKTAVKASKSTLPAAKFKPGPNSTAIATAASAAGLKAAKATAPGAPAKARTAPNYGNSMYSFTGKAPPAPKPGARNWLGDEVTPNCIVIAVANHLLHHKAVTAKPEELRALFEACDPEPFIEEVLWAAYMMGWPGRGVRLHDYRKLEDPLLDYNCLVIGYETDTDDGRKAHAALSLGENRVVSWGKVQPRTGEVEEAWALEWES